jgi:hypothetical protein
LRELSPVGERKVRRGPILLFPPFLFDLISGAVVLGIVVFLTAQKGIFSPWQFIGGAWAIGALLLPLAMLRTTNRFVLLAAAFWWVPLLGLLIINGLQHIGAN